MPVPSPETISGYEKLGIVGILLLVLIGGLIVIVWAVRELKGVATMVINAVTKHTVALTELKGAHEDQQETQNGLHQRLDGLMSCTRPGCPVFLMRKRQQKDAVRFDTPSSPTATTS